MKTKWHKNINCTCIYLDVFAFILPFFFFKTCRSYWTLFSPTRPFFFLSGAILSDKKRYLSQPLKQLTSFKYCIG